MSTPPAPASRLSAFLLRVGNALSRLPTPLKPLVLAAWIAGIWKLSSQEGSTRFEVEFWWGWLFNLGHAPVFGLLGLLLTTALLPPGAATRRPRVTIGLALLVLALVALNGAVDEWHQSHVPGRSSSVFDVVTDLVGAASVLRVVAVLGDADAPRARLWRRFAEGVLACAAAALLATLAD